MDSGARVRKNVGGRRRAEQVETDDTTGGARALALGAALGLTAFAGLGGYELADLTRSPANDSTAGVELRHHLAPAGQRAWPPPCNMLEDRAQCDLEVQWYSAQVAREAANLSFWQLLISILGAVGLGLTLAFTVRATRAAVRATEASEGALNHAREMAYHELRAYVTFGIAKSLIAEERKIEFRVPIVNTGQTPASSVEIFGYSILASCPMNRDALRELRKNDRVPYPDIMPHAERGRTVMHELSDDNLVRFNRSEMVIFVRLKINYTTYAGQRVEGPTTDWIITKNDLDRERAALADTLGGRYRDKVFSPPSGGGDQRD